jgi:hypothetical protein
MTIADKLLQINQVKQDIKTAIEAKGVPLTNVAFTEYANKILDISGEGVVDEYFYYDYAKLYYTTTNNSTLFENAWEHSLTVDPSEISVDSDYLSSRGKAQYPNGETEGVIIPQGVTNIGDYAFSGWQSNTQPLVIPNSVTSIGYSAFGQWQGNNQPLVIPNGVTSIGDYAFRYWNSNNQPLVIPDSVTSIGQYAFGNWPANNQPLVIPDSVTSIGRYAFLGWGLVPYVEMRAITPPTLVNANAFTNQNNAPIYVPDESVDDYKTATNWVNLASRIFSINDK